MPGAIQSLRSGFDKLGGVLLDAEFKRRKGILDLDLLQDIQQYQTDMAGGDDDYMQKFQGRNALDAEDQAKKRYKDGLDVIATKYEGNEYAQEYIQRHAGPLAVAGVGRMRDYGNKQMGAYDDSVYAGEVERLLAIARDWRSTPEQINGAVAGVSEFNAEHYARKGLDSTSAQVKLEALRRTAMAENAEARIDTAIKAGDFGEAERLLNGDVWKRGNMLPQDLKDLSERIGKEEGIDPAFIRAVIAVESGGKRDAVSTAGARGLMQLMPGTAKDLGVDPDDPEQNVRGGARFLKQLLNKYKDPVAALQAYNWGPGNMDAYLKTGKGKNGQDMPRETQEYVGRVLGTETTQAKMYLEPSKRFALESRLESARKAQEKVAVESAIQGALSELPPAFEGVPFEQWDDIVNTRLDRYPHEVKEGIRKQWKEFKTQIEDKTKAHDAALISRFLEKHKDMTSAQIQSEIEIKGAGFFQEGLSPNGLKLLKDRVKDYDIETPQNTQSMNVLYSYISKGAYDNKSADELRAHALAAGLTQAQTKRLVEFKDGAGIQGAIRKKMSVIRSALDRYSDDEKSRKKIEESDYIKALEKWLPHDKEITDEMIFKAVGNMMKFPELLEAARDFATGEDKLGSDFKRARPDLDRTEYAAIEARLRNELKRQPTDDEVKLYWRNQLGIPGGVPLNEAPPLRSDYILDSAVTGF
jgi:soluble lytic murein transglycosylase-like protein